MSYQKLFFYLSYLQNQEVGTVGKGVVVPRFQTDSAHAAVRPELTGSPGQGVLPSPGMQEVGRALLVNLARAGAGPVSELGRVCQVASWLRSSEVCFLGSLFLLITRGGIRFCNSVARSS